MSSDDTMFGIPVSVPDDSLDSLVEAASVPDLAAMFQSAKDAGHIKAVQEYGFTKV
jgi:hypothetical protein